MKKQLLLLLLFLICIVLGEIVLFIFIYNRKSTQTTQSTPPAPKAIISPFQQEKIDISLTPSLINQPTIPEVNWRLPILPVGYKWQQNTSQDEMTMKRIFYDGGEIPVRGSLHTVKVIDQEKPFEVTAFPFAKDITSQWKQLGWKENVTTHGYQFTGISGDGVQGRILGYVKVIDSYIRTIIYSYTVESEWKDAEKGLNLVCPCKTKLEIFISDPVYIPDFISNYSSNLYDKSKDTK